MKTDSQLQKDVMAELAWEPSILDRYYRKETLSSEQARRVFVFPDKLEPEKRG